MWRDILKSTSLKLSLNIFDSFGSQTGQSVAVIKRFLIPFDNTIQFYTVSNMCTLIQTVFEVLAMQHWAQTFQGKHLANKSIQKPDEHIQFLHLERRTSDKKI